MGGLHRTVKVCVMKRTNVYFSSCSFLVSCFVQGTLLGILGRPL